MKRKAKIQSDIKDARSDECTTSRSQTRSNALETYARNTGEEKVKIKKARFKLLKEEKINRIRV